MYIRFISHFDCQEKLQTLFYNIYLQNKHKYKQTLDTTAECRLYCGVIPKRSRWITKTKNLFNEVVANTWLENKAIERLKYESPYATRLRWKDVVMRSGWENDWWEFGMKTPDPKPGTMGRRRRFWCYIYFSTRNFHWNLDLEFTNFIIAEGDLRFGVGGLGLLWRCSKPGFSRPWGCRREQLPYFANTLLYCPVLWFCQLTFYTRKFRSLLDEWNTLKWSHRILYII